MSDHLLKISSLTQTLSLYAGNVCIKTYAISTGRNGLGEEENSEKTPRGWHEIAEKIGCEEAINTVFVAREPTGEIYAPSMKREFPDRDWILTRILRLRGLEIGRNSGNGFDSYERYIYIHGSPDEVLMGKPGSKGCIRMNNKEIIELADLIAVRTKLFIA